MMAIAINGVKSIAIAMVVQNIIGVSNIKTCILRYAIMFNCHVKTLDYPKAGNGN